MMERMDEMEKIHKDELLDLKGFYEKRITALRDIYERELHLYTEESEE
jgi:predicted P-loop ATPase